MRRVFFSDFDVAPRHQVDVLGLKVIGQDRTPRATGGLHSLISYPGEAKKKGVPGR
ncbi:uncharacterized protein PHALS_13116 [Plasmopara halstedii]|uniref:Uncharacterized protein n=1 Tax=Plasmopara halstedii TaxID=4781 RepID=A0A0P1AN86_PLAHL|nr:uncharacterized protein PHALS_13116 [Plasmopara halstedii]CEG42879.1 hypothetical protein PHALS_13116 [Plasmopara halstedii]|eukprot:XP_024579248.1 hypothetical protein PHALS_13116 [Plasmopara halstedii]